jgi:ubiquinone/menaquinone biosynthesis C-methylase UbiE
MSSSFTVRSGAGYDKLMGRWSRRLALPFIDFAGIARGERILDLGCGTGSLTFALPGAAEVSEVAAIDYSPVFVEEAQRRNTDPRITISQGDAAAIPFPDDRFDRALALLVLHFVPEAPRAVAEMRRVVRPGGVVAAAVWDHLGGMSNMRMVLDTLAAQDEDARGMRARYCFQPMMRPDEMRQTFLAQGLVDVQQTSLMIRMEYEDFADFWEPIAAGEGPLGQFVAGLDSALSGPPTRPGSPTAPGPSRQSHGPVEGLFRVGREEWLRAARGPAGGHLVLSSSEHAERRRVSERGGRDGVVKDAPCFPADVVGERRRQGFQGRLIIL